jgi:hypothetical protein
MARIRSVHPGLWTDEEFVNVSPLARLLCIGIWNEADDMGAFEWKPVQLKMRILPVDNVDINALLAELIGANRVGRYTFDGRIFGAVRNFGRYQRPKKPNTVHPMPYEWRKYAATDTKRSELGDNESGGSTELSEEEKPSVPKLPKLDGGEAAPVPKKSREEQQMEDRGWSRKGEERMNSLRSPFASDDFERFWQAYPRKVGKGAVKRIWPQVIKKTNISILLKAISSQRFEHRERFIPHPATWLREERWLDESGIGDPVLRAVGLTGSGPSLGDSEIPLDWLQSPEAQA